MANPTPLIGALLNANYGLETTWGTAVATPMPFGANIKLTNFGFENVITIKGGLGSALPKAAIPGAFTQNFSLEFDIVQNVDSLRWLATMLGVPDLSVAAQTCQFPATVEATNLPKSMTVGIGCDVTDGGSAEWTYIIPGCYCTSARFEAATGEALHCVADFVGAAPIVTNSAAAYAKLKMSSASIFTFTMASVTGAGLENQAARTVIDRATISISRDGNVKHGCGQRTPQAIITGLLSFNMDATIMYEPTSRLMHYSLGTVTAGVNPATAVTADPHGLADTALTLIFNAGAGQKKISFIGATMLVSKNALTGELNDAVMMDLSAQGTIVTVKLEAGS